MDSRTAVGKLWIAFVLGWLPVIGATGVLFVRDPMSRPRLAPALLLLALLVGLYLWLTLRDPIEAADLTAAGPPPSALRRRLSLLGAMTLAIAALSSLLPHAAAWWLVMHVVVAAGLVLPSALAAASGVILIVMTILAARLVSGHFDLLLLSLVAFGAAAIAIRQLTISIAQLRLAREELARAAVDQERLRFARDLHDLLGHSLSLIILKSELAGRLLPRSPESAAREIADAERAARDALREVRVAVAGYRQPVLRNELSAARELLDAAGIVADIEQAPRVPPELDGLLAWAVREGVTNVIRHSRAHRCTIRVEKLAHSIHLTVNDDGRGVNGDQPAMGNGLRGLAERSAACRAEMIVAPRPEGGFTLAITAPVRGDGESEE